jgi:RNA polymerase sigma-70 factor
VCEAVDLVEDVVQGVRVHLLVGAAADKPPRIDAYIGRGSLASWVRVVAGRFASSMRRSEQTSASNRANIAWNLVVATASTADVELDFVKARYQAAFVAALNEAFESLSRQQRLLLRMHFAQGLSVGQIATVMAKPRSTVGRWLLQARGAVFERAKAVLKRDLELATSQIESILRAADGSLDRRVAAIDRLHASNG